MKGRIIIKMVLKGMTFKLLSVSFSRWPEYLTDEQYSLEMPSKKKKKGKVSFWSGPKMKGGKVEDGGEREEEDILKNIFLTKKVTVQKVSFGSGFIFSVQYIYQA